MGGFLLGWVVDPILNSPGTVYLEPKLLAQVSEYHTRNQHLKPRAYV